MFSSHQGMFSSHQGKKKKRKEGSFSRFLAPTEIIKYFDDASDEKFSDKEDKLDSYHEFLINRRRSALSHSSIQPLRAPSRQRSRSPTLASSYRNAPSPSNSIRRSTRSDSPTGNRSSSSPFVVPNEMHEYLNNYSRNRLGKVKDYNTGLKNNVAKKLERDDSIMSLGVDEIMEDDSEIRGLQEQAAIEEEEYLAQGERKVMYLRIIFVVTFVLTSILCITKVYSNQLDFENKNAKASFKTNADKIQGAFYDSFERYLLACDSLSTTITSRAMRDKMSFPNITIADFSILGANTRVLSRSPFLFWLPLVTKETRNGWEEYATNNYGHLVQSCNVEAEIVYLQGNIYQKEKASSHYSKSDAIDMSRSIYLNNSNAIWGVETEEGPFLPLWQTSPAIDPRNLINYNFYDYPMMQGSYKQLLEEGNAVLDFMMRVEDYFPADIVNQFLSLGQYRYDISEYQNDPGSGISYPVFDNFGPEKKVVGVLSTLVYWRTFFYNVLPEGVDGIICTIRNSRNQTETFQINGPDVIYLGSGNDDHTLKKYTQNLDLYLNASVIRIVNERAGLKTRSYTSVDLDGNYIQYNIYIYPSDTFKLNYRSIQPELNAIFMAAVLFGTFLSFFVFDSHVRKRQAIIKDRAVKSLALVASLFPDNVREQLLGGNIVSGELDDTNSKSKGGRPWMHKQGSNDTLPTLQTYKQGSDSSLENHNRPIAEKFSDTTVFFADLAGFTKWSSQREPEDVFELLETIYHLFDKIALRTGVFKVETIGDCYMAVTGLPNPQPDHAVIMAKFAMLCLSGLERLVEDTELDLGVGADQLGMRIGMHSGEVTGGVLRGEKSRFQLFGDTVNTASRMESNGKKGCVHCSQETATLLHCAGMQEWLVEREDKIVAKGKGEMQTYWVKQPDSAIEGLLEDEPRKQIEAEIRSSRCMMRRISRNITSKCDEGTRNFNFGLIEEEEEDFQRERKEVRDRQIEDRMVLLRKMSSQRHTQSQRNLKIREDYEEHYDRDGDDDSSNIIDI